MSFIIKSDSQTTHFLFIFSGEGDCEYNIYIFFKKIFLILLHQNNMKILKNINLKKKIIIFLKNF